jgi:hypothetical protein
MKKSFFIIVSIFLVLGLAPLSQAVLINEGPDYTESWQSWFYNEYTANAIYLWSLEGNGDWLAEDTGLDASDWEAFRFTDDELFWYGPTLTSKNENRFYAKASGDDMHFAWAEVLWDADFTSYTMVSGFEGSSVDGFDFASRITAPVPEPVSILLFGVGLAGFAGFKKRFMKKFMNR